MVNGMSQNLQFVLSMCVTAGVAIRCVVDVDISSNFPLLTTSDAVKRGGVCMAICYFGDFVVGFTARFRGMVVVVFCGMSMIFFALER